MPTRDCAEADRGGTWRALHRRAARRRAAKSHSRAERGKACAMRGETYNQLSGFCLNGLNHLALPAAGAYFERPSPRSIPCPSPTSSRGSDSRGRARVIAAPRAVRAQQPQGSRTRRCSTPRAAAHVRDEYLADLDTVHVKIVALANAIPADKFSWRPAPGRALGVRSLHAHRGRVVVLRPAFHGWKGAGRFRRADNDGEAPRPREDHVEEPRCSISSTSHGRTAARSSRPPIRRTLTGKYKPWGMTVDAAAFGMSGDLHEHLGQLIAYCAIGRREAAVEQVGSARHPERAQRRRDLHHSPEIADPSLRSG